ncbi:hypothetical protein FRC09_000510, partial [Ceratobasidium sp. 395]
MITVTKLRLATVGSPYPLNISTWSTPSTATAQKKRSADAAAAQAPGKRSRIAFNNASTSSSNVASTSGKHPSAIPEKSRPADRKARVEGGREAGWSSGSSSNRHHPYPRKPAGDTNMGWMPKNHGERS